MKSLLYQCIHGYYYEHSIDLNKRVDLTHQISGLRVIPPTPQKHPKQHVEQKEHPSNMHGRDQSKTGLKTIGLA